MSNGKKARKIPWLKARSQPALKSEYRKVLAQIAKSAPSPNAAYDQAYLETGDIKLARACRWLAVAKRDHGLEALGVLLSSGKSQISRPTGTRRRETMSTGTKPETGVEQPEVTENKIPTLPLRQINFRATVNGIFARVRCVQEFKNDAPNPVEAVYTFPLPDEATITACQMRLGKRKVETVLKKRAEARKEYDEAVAAGHHGALLEQQRPNIFTMNVGGIEPGEKISVQVDYVQRVPWQAGGGRFRIPLVVAPRFIPGVPTGKQGGGWAKDTDQVPDASKITPPVAREGVSYTADISVSFTPGFACEVHSPTHPIVVHDAKVKRNETVEFKTGNIRPDRDFILTYCSLARIPEVAAFTGAFGNQGFLLTQIIPPGNVRPVASDIIFLLDISGSMSGPKIDGLKVVAKKVLQKLIEQKAGHNIGIIAFESQPHLLQPMTEISPAMEQVIDSLSSTGGTELGPALTLAFCQFKDLGRPKTILLVTDGQTESLRFTYGGARIIAAGIDTAVNDSTLKELTRNTNGACEWFYPGEDFDAAANRLCGMLSGPVLRDITVKSNGEAVGISDVFEGLPAAIAIRFPGKADKVEIRGKTSADTEAGWIVKPENALPCDFAFQLWAREFIRQTADAEKQVEVSLKYGVVCNGTSFVAISEKEVPGQKPERVEIPVNLPHGWNFEAVFGAPFAGLVLGSAGIRGGVDVDDIEICGLVGDSRAFSESLGAPFLRGGGRVRRHRPLPIKSTTPVLPFTPPSVPLPTPSVPRFSLEAKDPVDRLIAILIALNQGQHQEAEWAFKKLGITSALVKSWSEERRAMAFYFAARLRAYGLHLADNTFQLISAWPAKRQTVARSWHGLGLREVGSSFPLVEPPAGCDGYNYLLWKLGLGAKPASEPWLLVP